mmetsp:Transcript_17008/g.52216  ORF Transcript_17008/g.52216 Transcript_17008/m.52216 type:complete len:483 (+) Transcript_17008:1208-2656(+)
MPSIAPCALAGTPGCPRGARARPRSRRAGSCTCPVACRCTPRKATPRRWHLRASAARRRRLHLRTAAAAAAAEQEDDDYSFDFESDTSPTAAAKISARLALPSPSPSVEAKPWSARPPQLSLQTPSATANPYPGMDPEDRMSASYIGVKSVIGTTLYMAPEVMKCEASSGAAGDVAPQESGLSTDPTPTGFGLSRSTRGSSLAPDGRASPRDGDASPSSTYGRKADVWSLGACVVEMFTARPPFPSAAVAVYRVSVMGEGPALPAGITGVGVAFLRRTFTLDPANRPQAQELLTDAFCEVPDDDPTLFTATANPNLKFTPRETDGRGSGGSWGTDGTGGTNGGRHRESKSRYKNADSDWVVDMLGASDWPGISPTNANGASPGVDPAAANVGAGRHPNTDQEADAEAKTLAHGTPLPKRPQTARARMCFTKGEEDAKLDGSPASVQEQGDPGVNDTGAGAGAGAERRARPKTSMPLRWSHKF